MPQLAEYVSSQLAVERHAVAENPHTTTELLLQLAADAAWQVRLAVALHPKTDNYLQEQIFKALAG